MRGVSRASLPGQGQPHEDQGHGQQQQGDHVRASEGETAYRSLTAGRNRARLADLKAEDLPSDSGGGVALAGGTEDCSSRTGYADRTGSGDGWQLRAYVAVRIATRLSRCGRSGEDRCPDAKEPRNDATSIYSHATPQPVGLDKGMHNS